ncbi:hypothetical protein PT2222_280046 [Paraburkholderia tropica]
MRHLVVRAAQLEREDRLVVLALEQHRVADTRGEVRRGFELGFAGDVVHARGEDFLQVIVVGSHAGSARARGSGRENVDDSANRSSAGGPGRAANG